MVADAVDKPLVIFLLLRGKFLNGQRGCLLRLTLVLSGFWNGRYKICRSAYRLDSLRRQTVFQLPVPRGTLIRGVQNRMFKKGIAPLKESDPACLRHAFLRQISSLGGQQDVNTIPLKASPGKEKEIGYSLYIPCDLRKAKIQGFDIYYDGAINGASQEKAIVYKIMANKLPISYSEMTAYDRKTIRNNLIHYCPKKFSHRVN